MSGFGIPVLQIYTSDPSIAGSSPTAYIVTDHNRSPLDISYETIETSSRMANGTMRRFITANKKKISTSWTDVPAAGGYNFTADANLGAAWLKSFYEENIYNPIWIKLTYAEEGWRYAKNRTVASTDRFSSTNSTFNSTNLNANAGVPNTFTISNRAYSTFSASVSTASITTTTPHTLTAGAEVYIYGVDQLFNGTWIVASVPSPNTLTFAFNPNSSSALPATFKINSYVQNGSSAVFNVDNTLFLQNGMVFSLKGAKNNSGSVINGNWQITSAPNSQTSFTASWAGGSQTNVTGQYGTATILTTPSSYSSTVSSLNPAIIGPAVSADVLKVFITGFTYNIKKRFSLTDYVDMTIEFTEI